MVYLLAFSLESALPISRMLQKCFLYITITLDNVNVYIKVLRYL